MKIVSYNTAKKLKELGFDEVCEFAYIKDSKKKPTLSPMDEDWGGIRMNNTDLTQYLKDIDEGQARDVVAPSYIDVWLWLWRKKRVWIKIMPIGTKFHFQHLDHNDEFEEWHSNGIMSNTGYSDPEEAITAGIDYLIDNNLIG